MYVLQNMYSNVLHHVWLEIDSKQLMSSFPISHIYMPFYDYYHIISTHFFKKMNIAMSDKAPNIYIESPIYYLLFRAGKGLM